MHDRGRDAHYWAPPAQNRTGPIKASGSHLGCDGEALRLAVCALALVTRRPGTVSGTRFAGSHSPRPSPLAPPAPRPVARPRSSASRLLWRGLTSHARASSASARRLPDADQSGTRPVVRREISRFPDKDRLHMPGSATSQDRRCARVDAHPRVAFRRDKSVGVPIDNFAAQWLAYAFPCRRFVFGLATENARLGAGADRYSFTAVDLHHLLLAGLPAHCHRIQVLSGASAIPSFFRGAKMQLEVDASLRQLSHDEV